MSTKNNLNSLNLDNNAIGSKMLTESLRVQVKKLIDLKNYIEKFNMLSKNTSAFISVNEYLIDEQYYLCNSEINIDSLENLKNFYSFLFFWKMVNKIYNL